MVGKLVMLPVRVGVRVTGLWFRAIEETVSVTATATGRVARVLTARSSGGAGVASAPHPPASTTPPASSPEAPAESDNGRDRAPERARTDGGRGPEPSQPPTQVRDFAPPLVQPAPGPPLSAEPAHVSEEPELVEEFAEPGAEEGAGAEVRVAPPWDGYERMSATQVIARVTSASPAELAAVELYEGTHRARQTILNAVSRELRHGNRSGSETQERGTSDG